MSAWMLQGRLAPPAFRVALLQRPLLHRRLEQVLAKPVTVIAAPAGYGKTSLLTQWRAAQLAAGQRVAWLSLDDDDLDAAQLLSCVVMSLAQAGVALQSLTPLAEQGFTDTPVRAGVAALVNALATESRPVVLIVDDAHRLPRAAFESVLAQLYGSAAPALRLILSGRERPPLPLATLRTQGQLLDLGAEALRFTALEAHTLLPDLSTAQIDLLVDRTEGWPVALQLSRLWLDERPERIALIGNFSGRIAEVAEYLTEQVLADLDPAAVAVLRDSAVLEMLNADVVAAVTGRGSEWAKLIAARKLDYLLVPLDDERYWFRYHHLLSDYLRGQLRGCDPEHVVALHQRAASWFERNGQLREAVRHASLAGDYAGAAQLIERAGTWQMVLFGGAGVMRTLLRSIPEEHTHEFARVRLGQVLMLAKEGSVREATDLYAAVRAATLDFTRARPGQLEALRRDGVVLNYLLTRYADEPTTPQALTELDAEIAKLDPGEGTMRATLFNAGCLLGFATGDMQAALIACQNAVREMRRIGSLLGLNYCYMHLGLAHLQVGARREAEALFREAQSMAEENFGVDSGLRAVANTHLAVVLHARGDLDGAGSLFASSLEQVEGYDGWLDIFAEAFEAATALAAVRDGWPAVEAMIARARAVAEHRGLVRLSAIAEALAARWAAVIGPVDEANAALRRARSIHRVGMATASPDWWRVNFLTGLAAALIALREQRDDDAHAVLTDLRRDCLDQHRVRQQALVDALLAVTQFRRGDTAAAAQALAQVVLARAAENDIRILADLGDVLVPLAQQARLWSLDQSTSALGLRAIRALASDASHLRPVARVTGNLLSPRELDVLLELAQGAPNKSIAGALQMTENTVKFHLKNVFLKLGVRHRAEAILAARQLGLIA